MPKPGKKRAIPANNLFTRLSEEEQNEIKKEISKEVEMFINTKDYDGLYHYIRNITDDYENTNARENPEKAAIGLCRQGAVFNSLKDIAAKKNPDQDEFLHKFLLHCYIMQHSRIMEVSKSYEEITTRLKNGEVKDADLVMDNEKMVKDLAFGLSVYGTPAGRKMNQAKNIVKSVTDSLNSVDIDGFKQLNLQIKQEFNDYIEHNPTFPPEESKKYSALFDAPAPHTIEDVGLSEKISSFQIQPKSSDLSFTTVPDGITNLKKMDIKQLRAYHAQVMKDREDLSSYEQAAKTWADQAAGLLEKLQKVPGFDEKNPSYAPLLKALKNAQKISTGEYNYGENYMYCARRLSHRSVTFTLEDVISNAEKFSQTNPQLAGEIIKQAKESQNVINDNYTKSAQRVFDKYKENGTQAQVKMLDKRIARIEKELLYKNMCAVDPTYKGRLDMRIEHIGRIDMSHDLMRQFMTDTMDAVLISNTVKDFFDADKKGRDLTHGDHTKYNNLIRSIDNLQDLKTKNLRDMNYKEVMKILTDVRDASKAYIDSHDGLKNIGSGWSEKGRGRLGNAKYIYQKMNRQIEEMKALYNSEFNFDTQTLGSLETAILESKESLRKEIAEDMKKTAMKVDEKLFSATVKKASDALSLAKSEAGINAYPDKSSVADHYATLLAIETAREQHKNGGYGANERKLGILKENIKKSPEFTEMINSHTDAELYTAASNSKNPKALSDMFAKKQPQAEKVKQPVKGL